MSHLFINPEYMAIEKQLREMDRQRNHLRAQMADVALRANLAQGDSEFWLSPETRAERKAALEARIAKRTARRATEMKRYGCYTPPGPWDDDLDNHQEPSIEEDVEGGYKIRITRVYDLTFNAYVIIPADHPMVGRDYDFFHNGDIPSPPVALTYGGRLDAEDGRTYGFYHNSTSPLGDSHVQYDPYNYFNTDKIGGYITFEEMRTAALKLVDYFKSIAHLPPLPEAEEVMPEPFPEWCTWICTDCGIKNNTEVDICESCGKEDWRMPVRIHEESCMCGDC